VGKIKLPLEPDWMEKVRMVLMLVFRIGSY
jgi:hypothetical protein